MAAGGAGDIEGALLISAKRCASLEPALQELRRTNELAEGFYLVQTEIYMCEAVLADSWTTNA